MLRTPRKEANPDQILSGLYEGRTLGTSICINIYNSAHHSNEYEVINIAIDLDKPNMAPIRGMAGILLMEVECGIGTEVAKGTGRSVNDPFSLVNGHAAPISNNAGGVLGGNSTGLHIYFKYM